jgi:hypothetical protein
MKLVNKFVFAQAIVLSAALLAGCSKSGKTDAPAEPEKTKAPEKPGVTVDDETQKRIGLTTAFPVATQWQPEIKGQGHVIEPAVLTTAAADLASAQAAAEVSRKEYERQQSLVADKNISARALETAGAAATHDALAVDSARAKFKQDWGAALADDDRRHKILPDLVSGAVMLVRIDLPAGESLSALPASARIVTLTDETNSVNGEFLGATAGVNPQTQSPGFFFLAKGAGLLPGAAVNGYLKISGDPMDGVIVPFSAVLRHEGLGWVYVQTDTNQFLRTQIPLDRLGTNGWFVSDAVTATNLVVVTGTQTVLSTELSQGGFNTGTRD